MRLLSKHKVKIPKDSGDLRGMEPAQSPNFHLDGCFVELLSDQETKWLQDTGSEPMSTRAHYSAPSSGKG